MTFPRTLPITKNRLVGTLEDESFIAKIVDEALSIFGFESRHLTGTNDALELARSGSAVAFVLDVQIYGKSLGLDVLEMLKEADPNTFVCIYSGYVDRPHLRERALRLGADFIQPKGDNPREDLCRIGREVVRHEVQLAKLQLELIELELARFKEAGRPLINWEEKIVNPIDMPDMPLMIENAYPVALCSEDENQQLFDRLLRDEHWFKAHRGTAVAVVDGMLVVEARALQEAISEVRGRYPHKDRFVGIVEREPNHVDVPTPFDVEV